MHRIIQGHDGPLKIDEDRQTVTKTYLHCDHETALRQAEREVSYATRLSAALSHVAGLACPRILDWDLTPPPCVVMTLCPGQVLSRFLRQPRRQDAVAKIADRIHRGIDIYIGLFGEACHDFSFQNMLYDETTEVLTLLDFGLPARIDETPRHPPLEASLGNLVGCACYDLVQPSHLLSPKQGYLKTLRAVLATFEGRVCNRRIRTAAQSALMRLTQAGGAGRRKYYDTIGAAMVRRYFDQLKLGPAAAASANITGCSDGISDAENTESTSRNKP